MRLGPVLEAKIRTLMAGYEREESALIPALTAVQAEYGWVDSEAAKEVSALFGITPERVEEILSFYSLLQRSPGGRHRILLCRSLVCSGGAEKILKVLQEEYSLLPGGTSPDGRFSLFLCECLGHCENAPAIMVDDRVYGPIEEGNLFSLLEGFK